MPSVDAFETYFRGEKQVGVALAAWGLVLLVGALWVWRNERTPLGTGLLVPLLLLGVGFSIGGTVLALKTGPQLTALITRLGSEPAVVVDAELTRMGGVNANWPRLKLAWAVLGMVALLLILAVRREWSEGVGLGLLVLVTTLMFVDLFAERRASIYTAALKTSADSR